MQVFMKVTYVLVECGDLVKYNYAVTEVEFGKDEIKLIRYGEVVQRIPTATLNELHIAYML